MDKQTVLIIVGLVIILILINLLHSDVFEIKEIEIKGNELITDNYILNFSDLNQGTNIFAMDCQKIKEKLSLLPQFKEVLVFRKLPNKIVIEVTEREPIAIIPLQSSYCLINKEGWILKIINNLSQQQWPVVEGIEVERERKKIQVTEDLKVAIELLLKLTAEISQEIEKVKILKSGFRLELASGGIVKLGQDFDVEKKAEVFISIYQDIKERNLEIEYVDLRYNKHSFIKTK